MAYEKDLQLFLMADACLDPWHRSCGGPGWSNGRDVVTWCSRIFRAYALRRQEQVGKPAVLTWPATTVLAV